MEHEIATNRRPDRPEASDPAAEHLAAGTLQRDTSEGRA
jgi:hypothetical protein